jgi:hypothetical protein
MTRHLSNIVVCSFVITAVNGLYIPVLHELSIKKEKERNPLQI